ncbi:hypothetical protein Emag_004601 [Eimeria magna]
MESKQESPVDFALYSFDEEDHNELLHSLQQHHQRLRRDLSSGKLRSPVVFTDVWISDLALTKMLLHAESGGRIEVMGLLLGKAAVFSHDVALSSTTYEDDMRDSSDVEDLQHVKKGYFVVTDCFALPVEGTETRVNAAEEANEYMIEYLEAAEKIPTLQKVVGWFHSHPNYGCWLSGIDVRTQQLQQQHQDPFLAIVVDPIRTLSNGRVEIGAFRTFLPGEENTAKDQEEDAASELLPAEKAHDFGVHWQQYNRPLELRRLEMVVDACQDANKSIHSSHQGNSNDVAGKGLKAEFDAFDSVGPSDFAEELGVLQVTTMSQKLAGIGDQAGQMAVRALTELVETANISAICYDNYTWKQHLQLVDEGHHCISPSARTETTESYIDPSSRAETAAPASALR